MSESFLVKIYILIVRSTRAAAGLLNQDAESPRNTFAQETNTIGNVTLSRNRAGPYLLRCLDRNRSSET